MFSTSINIRRVSDNLKLGKLIVWLWIGCILVTVVSSQEDFYPNGRFGKRKDSQFPFQSGSRYGRSDEKAPKVSSKNLELVPRVDRFFYGSRYGKRSLPLELRRDAEPVPLGLRHIVEALDLERQRQEPQQQQQQQQQQQSDELADEAGYDTELHYGIVCSRSSKACYIYVDTP